MVKDIGILRFVNRDLIIVVYRLNFSKPDNSILPVLSVLYCSTPNKVGVKSRFQSPEVCTQGYYY